MAFRFTRKNKGQSFVELAIVLGVLLTLLFGMVEFAFLLNTYITVVDASRQGARFASTKDPYYTIDYPTLNSFYSAVRASVEGAHVINITSPDLGALSPIRLDPSKDDVIISFVTVQNASSFTRTPASGYHAYGNGLHTTKVTNTDIQASISANLAPTGSGLIIVEIFYDCSIANGCLIQIFPILPDTIEIYTYSVMPMASVKPPP
jgi:Flp pilus assembly protein TadG